MGWKPTLRIEVKDNGSVVGTRRSLNLIEGTDITLTIADDSANDEIDVTVASTAGGGGSGAWTLVETKDITTTTTTVSFTSIAGSYNELVLVGSVRSDRSASKVDEMMMRFGNGSIDSGNNYDAMGWSWPADSTTAQTEDQGVSEMLVSRFTLPTDGLSDADIFGNIAIHVPLYADTDHDAHFWAFASYMSDDTDSSVGGRIGYAAGRWRNTAAVDHIDLFWTNGDFVAGSEIRLYGVT